MRQNRYTPIQRQLRFVVIVVAAIPIIVPTDVTAEPLVVSPDGDTGHDSFQAAIDAVDFGDRIEAPGVTDRDCRRQPKVSRPAFQHCISIPRGETVNSDDNPYET